MSKIVLLEGNTDYFKAEVSFGEIGLVLSSYDKKHSLEGSNIGLSKHQALQLAAAITEHYSEWLPMHTAPLYEHVWVKYKNNHIEQKYIVNDMDFTQMVGYQPIHQPKP